MRPHPWIRKSVKWGGAAVCIALAALWAASLFYSIGVWPTPRLCIGIEASGAGIYLLHADSNPITSPGLHSTERRRDQRWWPSWGRQPLWSFVMIPLWTLLVPALAATITAWRPDTLATRRGTIGLCPICGYDRRGLPGEGVCPECGDTRPPPQPTAR